MNITEAMKISEKTGQSFSRGGGWVKFDQNWIYKLSVADILSEKWEICNSEENRNLVKEKTK